MKLFLALLATALFVCSVVAQNSNVKKCIGDMYIKSLGKRVSELKVGDHLTDCSGNPNEVLHWYHRKNNFETIKFDHRGDTYELTKNHLIHEAEDKLLESQQWVKKNNVTATTVHGSDVFIIVTEKPMFQINNLCISVFSDDVDYMFFSDHYDLLKEFPAPLVDHLVDIYASWSKKK